ncbi:glycosyltransferase family 4 protein [candidate division KSB1 bacterium]|nr:glycosyltransferase family 4 protein [candidate division KSB1 bacterium]
METFIGDMLNSSLAARYRLLLLDIAKPKLRRSGTYAIDTGYAVFQRRFGSTMLSYGYSGWFFLKYLHLLFSRKIDIIHIHTASYTSFWEKCAYICAGKVAGKKIVVHIHGALFKEFYKTSSRPAQKLIIRFLRRCDAIFVLSRSWKDFFSKIVCDNKLYIVENGINLAPFKNIGKKPARFSIVHMGEVSARKGIYDILKVAEVLQRQKFKVHFDIVGPGELDKVSALIQQKKIEDYITLHGAQFGEKRYVYFQRAHCFILASYGEGFPIALIEALAAGLPVVTTRVGGIPDMITHGVHGFLCEPGNIDEIANAIQHYIQNSKTSCESAEENRLHANTHFNIECCADKIAKIYRDIMS